MVGLCHVSCFNLKPSMLTDPEQVVSKFLLPPFPSFLFPPPLPKSGRTSGCCVWCCGVEGQGRIFLPAASSFLPQATWEQPDPPLKELSYLLCPSPLPTGQFHFCSQISFQAPSAHGTPTPGTPFLQGHRWPFARDKATQCSPFRDTGRPSAPGPL